MTLFRLINSYLLYEALKRQAPRSENTTLKVVVIERTIELRPESTPIPKRSVPPTLLSVPPSMTSMPELSESLVPPSSPSATSNHELRQCESPEPPSSPSASRESPEPSPFCSLQIRQLYASV